MHLLLESSDAHTGRIWDLAPLPDNRFASVSSDGSVKIWHWDAKKGIDLLHSLHGHTGFVRCIETLSDGRLLTGGNDRNVLLWLPDDQGGYHQDPLLLESHKRGHYCAVDLCLVGNDKLVVSWGDNTLEYWQLKGNSMPRHMNLISTEQEYAGGMAVLSDNRLITNSLDNLKIWDLDKPTGKQCLETRKKEIPGIRCITRLEGKGHRFATGSYSYRDRRLVIDIWDMEHEAPIATLMGGHKKLMISSLVSLSGNRLASAATDGTICLWDLDKPENQQLLKTINVPDGIEPTLTLLGDQLIVGNHKALSSWPVSEFVQDS